MPGNGSARHAGVGFHGAMHHRTALPRHLGSVFLISDAIRSGVGTWRGSTPDLDRPFRAVRATEQPATFLELVRCYRPRLRPGHRLVGWSAVRLWGMPTFRRWTNAEAIQIAVPRDAAPPRGPRVQGRRLDVDRADTWQLHRVAVVDPLAAVLSVARDLTLQQAVVLLDALLSRADDYPGLVVGRPVITREQIEQRVASWRSFPGSSTIRKALPLAREGVESPKETETRLMLIDAGLPEPVVQHEVFDGGRRIARIDLAYPELRIAIEYEGDGHRTDKEQWRRDIQRQRDLEDRGWIVIRLTQRDLHEGRESLITRIRRAIRG